MNDSINNLTTISSVNSENTELLNNNQLEEVNEIKFNGFTPVVSNSILGEVLEDNANKNELLDDNQVIDNLFDDNQEIETLGNDSVDVNRTNNNISTSDKLFNINNDSEVLDEQITKDEPNNEVFKSIDIQNSEIVPQANEISENLNNNVIEESISHLKPTIEDIPTEITEETINVLKDNVTSINEVMKEELSQNDGELVGIPEDVIVSSDNVNEESIHKNNEENKETKDEVEFPQKVDNKTIVPQTLLEKYGENLTAREFVCNPAIGRDNEIKQLILTLLTPEKSAILVGKPGIGKTAIVEGLGYQIKRGNVPLALADYTIYKLNTSSLLGIMPETNEPKIQVLLNELKGTDKLILFIDEIHTLIGSGAEDGDSLDFANIFKPGLDRGSIKIIGATTSDEYDRYILTDKAFVRRFQKIEVLEPTKEHTVKILMGSLPKLEHKTNAKLKYTPFIQEKIMTFIVDITSEYRRVYELSARYPDVALTILQQAFSYAVFDNKNEVSIRDVRKAIANTKLVYSDVIKKELIRFNEEFHDIYHMETIQRLRGETSLTNE